MKRQFLVHIINPVDKTQLFCDVRLPLSKEASANIGNSVFHGSMKITASLTDCISLALDGSVSLFSLVGREAEPKGEYSVSLAV